MSETNHNIVQTIEQYSNSQVKINLKALQHKKQLALFFAISTLTQVLFIGLWLLQVFQVTQFSRLVFLAIPILGFLYTLFAYKLNRNATIEIYTMMQEKEKLAAQMAKDAGASSLNELDKVGAEDLKAPNIILIFGLIWLVSIVMLNVWQF